MVRSPDEPFDPLRWINQQIQTGQFDRTPLHLRPRERLLRDGAASLSDADLLAILIRVGVPRESAVVGAQKIVDQLQRE